MGLKRRILGFSSLFLLVLALGFYFYATYRRLEPFEQILKDHSRCNELEAWLGRNSSSFFVLQPDGFDESGVFLKNLPKNQVPSFVFGYADGVGLIGDWRIEQTTEGERFVLALSGVGFSVNNGLVGMMLLDGKQPPEYYRVSGRNGRIVALAPLISAGK
jgi:hypothetical protein